MIPPVVAKILDDDEGLTTDTDAMAIAQDMTSAHLRNYERFSIKGYAYPAIVPSTSSGDIVEGFVIFRLTDEQRDLINDCYDDSSHPYDLKSVEVEILLAPGECRTIHAATYVWAGSPGQLMEISIHSWTLEDYLRDYYASDLVGER